MKRKGKKNKSPKRQTNCNKASTSDTAGFNSQAYVIDDDLLPDVFKMHENKTEIHKTCSEGDVKIHEVDDLKTPRVCSSCPALSGSGHGHVAQVQMPHSGSLPKQNVTCIENVCACHDVQTQYVTRGECDVQTLSSTPEMKTHIDEGALKQLLQSVVAETVKESMAEVTKKKPAKSQTKSRAKTPQSRYDSSSSSSAEGTDSESVPCTANIGTRRSFTASRKGGNVKLPAFLGKESWKVWRNRFEEIAERRGWSDEDKLDELLPKLQGQAGDFVFSQLPKIVRSNYGKLVAELNNRYRVIENSKAFSLKFSRRDQKPGESVEEYAAALKELYDKAYEHRDPQTRQEDLLRRFLDGLIDEKARFQVEYTKQPGTIDDAVYEVVNFHETMTRVSGDRSKKQTRMVREDSSDTDAEENDADDADFYNTARAARVQPKFKQPEQTRSQNVGHGASQPNDPKTTAASPQLLQHIELLEKRIKELEGAKNPESSNSTQGQTRYSDTRVCYNCGKPGHIRRYCRANQSRMNYSTRPAAYHPYAFPPPPLPPMPQFSTSPPVATTQMPGFDNQHNLMQRGASN